jgi:hypothetical protein
MQSPKPFVNIACLCEKILTEKDDVLSLIRLVDSFTVSIPPNMPTDTKPHLTLNAVLGLRQPPGETITGKHVVKMRLHGPTKASSEVPKFDAEFADGKAGLNLLMALVLGIENYGQCRLDVEWDGEILTSIPFTLTQAQAQNDASTEPPKSTPSGH